MARLKQKKGEAGAAVNYITRTQAVKKLQISLAAFRRLCILKGIYPRDPTNKKKAGKGSTAPRTYYYRKDIQYLLHEPILQKFREQKTHKKKVKKATLKRDWAIVKALQENKPEYSLDHVIKERYPTFVDALRDLDDALAMVFLFATLPVEERIQSEQVKKCQRLSNEFLAYVMLSRSLRKVFLSVKGVYYQVEIMGQEVTWIVPYKFSQNIPQDVDFKVMGTFLELYITLIGFVNFRLYSDAGIAYPPKNDEEREANDAGITSFILESLSNGQQVFDFKELQGSSNTQLAALAETTQSKGEITSEMKLKMSKIEDKIAEISSKEILKHQDNVAEDLAGDGELTSLSTLKQAAISTDQMTRLFEGCVFWLSRETPRWSLEFIIRAFGGKVGWDDDSTVNLRPKVLLHDKKMGVCHMKQDDPMITHHIVDRPLPTDGSVPTWMQYENREYLQPQWIYDCINSRRLLTSKNYRPSETLPPHLSPFVVYGEDDYRPEGADMFQEDAAKESIIKDKENAIASTPSTSKQTLSTTLQEAEPSTSSVNAVAKTPVTAEDKERALLMMKKKDRQLYQKIQHGKAKKKASVDALKSKKSQISK